MAEQDSEPSESAELDPDSAPMTTVAPGYIPRQHGVVLTSASVDVLAECMRRGQYDVKKVVADWGQGPAGTGWGPPGGWTDALRHRVLNDLTPWVPNPGKTIVRTVAGDGQYSNDAAGYDQGYKDVPGSQQAPDDPKFYPTPDRVVASIAPWYNLRQDIYVEIGNEPNTENWWLCATSGDADKRARAYDFIYKWKWYFRESLRQVRQRFPNAKIISPGLAGHFEEWYEICRPEFSEADAIGFHQFGEYDFFSDWSQRIIPCLTRHYAGTNNKPWYCTECGVDDQGAPNPPGFSPYPSWMTRKGRVYAELAHFGKSNLRWPSNVIGMTYFHLNTDAVGTKGARLQYDIYRHEGDYAYRTRVNYGNVLSFQAANGKYVCADGSMGGPDPPQWSLSANRDWVQAWERFETILVQESFALMNGNGMYVCADRARPGVPLIADRRERREWEVFDIFFSPDRSRAALRASNGKYVRADGARGWRLFADLQDNVSDGAIWFKLANP